MENTSVLNKSDINIDSKVRTNFNVTKFYPERTIENPVIDNLVAEGGENFSHYLNWLGLVNDPSLLVLSSRHHFYYDSSELKGVTTLINLKKLNLIKHLDSFLHTVCHALSPKTNFIGCFSDWKIQNGNRLSSRMYKGFINFLDSKIDIEVDKKGVSRLLESHGFKVIDMTEINGLTYFRAQNNRRSVE
jgi:hypothetical protein